MIFFLCKHHQNSLNKGFSNRETLLLTRRSSFSNSQHKEAVAPAVSRRPAVVLSPIAKDRKKGERRSFQATSANQCTFFQRVCKVQLVLFPSKTSKTWILSRISKQKQVGTPTKARAGFMKRGDPQNGRPHLSGLWNWTWSYSVLLGHASKFRLARLN